MAVLEHRASELIRSGDKSVLVAVEDEVAGRDDGHSGTATDLGGFAMFEFRVSVWFDDPVALLEELYVKPGLRGRGMGRALMDAFLAASRERGAAMVEVITGEDDTAARGLYESTGFSNQIEGEDNSRALYYEMEL